MKNIFKRGLSMVLVLVLCFGVLPGLTVTADAAGWLYNWGSRGTVATGLSDNAVAFYAENETSYEQLSSLSGSANLSTVAASSLYLELQELMTSNHSYKNSYNATKEMYAYTDCQNGGGMISSFYSGLEVGPTWDGTFNREHTWPNSKGLGGSDENDIMMLRPTSYAENGGRSNTAYGESTGYYDPNSESNGALNLHGDVARIFLYVYVRWGNVNGNGEYDTWGARGVIESKEVLLKWMAEDPVDTWELGRNDSVESITGTRNVFVDYPELAFLLFDEEVPSGMVTPSGEASSDSYTVTAAANNDAYGTVSVSGKVITASPAAGYAVSGYEVTSGTAAVIQSGNSFIVNASSNCTVQINFAPKANTVVTFVQNGTVVSSQTVYSGDAVTLPGHTGAAPEGYTFVGWSNGQISDTTDYPTACMKAGDTFTASGDTTLYALYSYQVEGEGGGEATSNTAVVSIADYADANGWANGTQYPTVAMDTNVTVTATGGGNTGKYYTSGENWRIYQTEKPSVVVSAAEGCTIESVKITYNKEKGGVLTYNGANISSGTTVEVGASSVTFGVGNDSGKTNGQARITAMEVVYSRAASSGPAMITYYTTGITPTCLHTNITKIDAKLPTCTTEGWTDGWSCNDCTYVYGHETVAATGHVTAVWMDAVPGTCNAYGIKGHYHCDICDADYLEQSATAHTQSAEDLRLPMNLDNHDADTEIRNAVAATCSATGYSGDVYCIGCNTKLESGTVIPKQSHEIKAVAAVAATHKTPGNIAHYTCSGCGKYYSDAEGKNELTAAEVVIPQIAHSFGDYQYDANGHWKECSCGAMSEEGAHTYGNWVIVKAATQTAEGSKERTCSACGYKQTEKIPVTSSPSTGDSAMIFLWAVLLTVSACGIAMCILVPAKKKYQR